MTGLTLIFHDPDQVDNLQIRLKVACLLHDVFSEAQGECDSTSPSDEQRRRIVGKNDVCQSTCRRRNKKLISPAEFQIQCNSSSLP